MNRTSHSSPHGSAPHHRRFHACRTSVMRLLFAVFLGMLLLLSQMLLMLTLSRMPGAPQGFDKLLPQMAKPKLQLGTMGFTYICTLLGSLVLFPRLWHRSFSLGLSWNADAAKKYALRLIPTAIVLSLGVQALQSLIAPSKSAPIEDFFTTQSDVWLMTFFGTLLAPLTEEIFFRGFLLPAIAIAFDWITLKREPAAYQTWASTDTVSTQALVFSGLVGSACFAVIHAAQIGYAWRSVAVLMVVSWVLTVVRVRLKSVAASTLLHATYNFTIFAVLFIQTGGYRHLDKIKA